MTAKTLMRHAVSQEDKWNVEALFSSPEEWKKEFEKICRPHQTPHWPQLALYKDKLGESAGKLKDLLNLMTSLERQLSKLYTYAHLRHDEDMGDEEHKKIQAQISFIFQDFGQEIAWIEPEILALPKDKQLEYLNHPLLSEYRIYLTRLMRLMPHTLSAKEEALLAQLGKPLLCAAKSFGAFNNADLRFPNVTDEKGESHELTHGKFQLYLRSTDRSLRQNAFKTLHETFSQFENMLTELLQGHVQVHLFNSRARNYTSCLEASLFPHEIDTRVYDTLIDTVGKQLPVLHRYMSVRRTLLGVDSLYLYDLHVPLIPDIDISLNYREAEEKVIASVAPLGQEYQEILQRGLKAGRWVDRYENARKRSGAYSSGCYDSMPYILMNYQGTFHDMMTLAHEAGHSMHSLLSNRQQPYHYSQYPLFLAEIASTFNEELLFHHLLTKEKNKEIRRFLINQKLDDIRATFFRQILFAEFERKIHQLAEKGIPLTPGLLKEEYLTLNRIYFGPEVTIDPEIAIEWARIPHFYNNFYVYQYATGISAAYAFFEKVMREGQKGAEAYLNFLSSGSSRPPLDLLREAGIDLCTAAPIQALIGHFDELVNQLLLIH